VRTGATFGAARDQALVGLADRDGRLAYELAAGVLRRQAALDRTLDLSRADPRLHDILRLGTYQLTALARVPPYAAVSTSVALARETAGDAAARYVNRALRDLTRERPTAKSETHSHPAWLTARWRARFGAAETERLVAWNDTRPALTLQPVRWDQDRLAAGLRAAGCGVADAPFGAGLRVYKEGAAPHALRAPDLPGFAAGAFIVQDAAHALVCRFAAPDPGASVYDACAAPGGKAVLLAARGAQVTAGDARHERLARLTETLGRAGVAARVVLADLGAAPFRSAAFDAVLVDAPCTATGTMARHPDARWRITPDTITRAAARQRRLLDAAAALVRPGGTLTYATCSLEPEENGDQVNAFLERHPQFRRAPVTGAVPSALVTAAGDFESLPQRDGTDGAFAARLVRER
jgi:16S rRNA (cytosine967-C5)-methyltransferase